MRDHHARAWHIVADASRNITDRYWCEGDNKRLVPARVGYHLLMAGERYTWQRSADDYLTQRRYGMDWLELPLEQLPLLSDYLVAMEAMAEETDQWLRDAGDEGLLRTPSVWPWCGTTLLGQALYLLRHTQYHVGDLNCELRRLGLATAKWQ